jgi:hypothetical protein
MLGKKYHDSVILWYHIISLSAKKTKICRHTTYSNSFCYIIIPYRLPCWLSCCRLAIIWYRFIACSVYNLFHGTL